MIAGTLVVGLGGAILSGAAALAAGHTLPVALCYYAIGGSGSLLITAVMGRRA